MIIYLKKLYYQFLRMIHCLSDIKYVSFNYNSVGKNGIVLLSHDSENLGASMLLLSIAKELKKNNCNVVIISKCFGPLNDKFAELYPVKVTLTKSSFKRIVKRLNEKDQYCRLLSNTVVVGDLIKISKDMGYEVVSLIHELKAVVENMHMESETMEIIKYSDKIVFSTSVAKNEIFELTKTLRGDVYIRPQGIYFQKPSTEKINLAKGYMINKYPQLQDGKIVLGVGNTTYRKGLDIFINTAKMCKEDKFVWAGFMENEYTKIVNECGPLPTNFIYLGILDQEELAAVYSLANIFFLSSRHDTLPSVLFEAILFGLPIVGAKDSGGIVDIVNDDIGILTEKCDATLFCNAIKQITKEDKAKNIKDYLVENEDKLSFEKYVHYLLNLFSE